MGCIMNLLFVIVLSPELFLSTPVFHRPQKPVFLNSKSHSVDMLLEIFILFHLIATNILLILFFVKGCFQEHFFNDT